MLAVIVLHVLLLTTCVGCRGRLYRYMVRGSNRQKYWQAMEIHYANGNIPYVHVNKMAPLIFFTLF